ncbi:Hypothetical protein NTJ_00963 [Nesidiocoris tenuis]|uniref:Uncharacterized protein n=1 Tax=Nesidiocoris tenuis TaxID=355587 RepID=A0ABN7AAA2_9HEMI|nr:Hypothetical protein NTJ_00963 [Nesidiocoris tenuis]
MVTIDGRSGVISDSRSIAWMSTSAVSLHICGTCFFGRQENVQFRSGRPTQTDGKDPLDKRFKLKSYRERENREGRRRSSADG